MNDFIATFDWFAQAPEDRDPAYASVVTSQPLNPHNPVSVELGMGQTASVGESGTAVFKGAPGAERERIAISETAPANLTTRLVSLRAQLEPGIEKLSLHIRRPRAVAALGAEDDLIGTLATEVEGWLKPLEEIRLA